MSYIYMISLLVSIGMVIWLKLFDVRNSTIQFVNLLILVVGNLGFYLEAVSTSLDELVMAHKIAYAEGVFLPILYMLMVMEICHLQISKKVVFPLMMIQGVIYGFACTMGKNDLFYKNIGMYVKGGVSIISKEYGAMHTVNLVTVYGYIIAAVVIAIYSLIKNKSVNRRGVIAMMVLCILAFGTYIVEKAIHFDYELMPMIYDILMIGALIPIYDSNIYTVYENTEIINEQLDRLGFLTFDKKKRYKGCDTFMEKVFPELSDYHYGKKIENCSEELQNLINQISKIDDISKLKKQKDHDHADIDGFLLNDKFYAGRIHVVTNTFGTFKGYTIELRDDTDHYRTLEFQEKYNDELSKEVYEKTKRIRSIQQKTIMGMAQMVESRDLSTGGHIKRTSDVVRIFSKKLSKGNYGLDKKFLRLVIRSAPMHDLGKIGVDDAILRKQGRFTDEEYEKMKSHAEIGYHMVSEILSDVEEPEFVSVAKNVAHYHHEKVNGTGYPHGLKGDEIPVEARIMALADVFDALVSKRCYKEAFSYDKAFEIIEKDSGTHFDADLAKVFLSCREELEDYYNKSE